MADTKFKKGMKKLGGRKKGIPNQSTVQMKEAIRGAFEELGGQDYLIAVGEEDPKTFLSLMAKLLPQEISADINHTVSLADALEALDEPDETTGD